jgi:capsular polysaccharide biosynthesis protein
MAMNLIRGADPRALRRSIVAGAVVALLLLVGGLAFALSSKAQWTAESVSAVLPDTQLSDTDAAAYYETLSRGQIVATFAEVASNKRFEQQAERNLDLDAQQQAGVASEVVVAPSTSVVLIRVTSEDRGTAEQVAAEMTTVSQAYLKGLARPYRLEVVDNGAGSSFRSSTSPLVLVAAALVVALVGGVAIQQAVYHTMSGFRPGSREGLPALASGNLEEVPEPPASATQQSEGRAPGGSSVPDDDRVASSSTSGSRWTWSR